MELLIVRHGVAYERDARRWPRDAERPLSPEGITRAHRAAAGLRRLAPRPLRVLVSPLVRTAQTAALLTQSAGWPVATPCALLAPGGAPRALLALLARSGRGPIALVGHEPDLGQLLASCLPGRIDGEGFEIRKMGAALVSFSGRPAPAGGVLVWFAPPKLLRALGRGAR